MTECSRIPCLTLVVLTLAMPAAQGFDGSDDIEWRHYGGDSTQNKYSPAAQIGRSNVGQLEVAWRWTSIDHR